MKKGVHQNKKPVDASDVEGLKSTLSSLKDAYSENVMSDVNNLAISLVEQIPVIGNIVKLFSKDHSTSAIESKLVSITNDLQALSRRVENIGNNVEKLSYEIDLSVLKIQVANAKLKINNCKRDFLLLLKNPGSKAEQDRSKNCYSKFEYARQIGSLLKHEKLTFMQKPLFDQIIDYNGYCNGKNINDVYQYLLGLYIEGCMAFVSAEILSYNSSSTTYQNECSETFHLAERKRLEMYDVCKAESCERYLQEMIRILRIENTSVIQQEFHRSFPWYLPIIIIFQDGKGSDVTLYGGNRLTFTNKGIIYRLIMWSSQPVSTNGTHKIGVEYNMYSVDVKIDDIGLSNNSHSSRTALVGKYIIEQSICKKEMKANETVEHQFDYVKLVGGLVLAVFIPACCGGLWIYISCCRKRNNDSEADDYSLDSFMINQLVNDGNGFVSVLNVLNPIDSSDDGDSD